MPKEWYLSDSDKYLSGYENEEFTLNATSAFDEILLNSPESYDVLINDVPNKAIIQTKSSDIARKILTRIGDISCGDIVDYKKNKWLAVDFADDNRMYESSIIKLCNTTFHLELDKTTVLLRDENGNPILDNHGRPIYEEVPNTKDVPCVVETKYYFNNRNEQITLPEDRVMISIQYQEANNLKENAEFNLYNSRFSIKFIDYTKVVNDKGVMIITGERVMNKDGNV